ncbi:MAG TPA: response regulator transcription factor [Epsilonproteobacteria bacterium]|nr:response regulator transcription factor [Campylobacterota bacterium]
MELPQHIMIVEDEVITQRYLKNILEQYTVDSIECYDNAKYALAQFKNKEYDMILMDINIKGAVDGIQLAREILRIRDVPIIFITAHNDNETFQEVLELSPFGFITKPFSAKDVELSIQLAYKRHCISVQAKQSKEEKSSVDMIVISDEYHYSLRAQELYYNDTLVKLNMKQNKLVHILCKYINTIVTYETLVMAIWEVDNISSSALRTLVYTLRKSHPDLPIISHSKVGYSLKTTSDI